MVLISFQCVFTKEAEYHVFCLEQLSVRLETGDLQTFTWFFPASRG